MCAERRGLDRFARDFTLGYLMMMLLVLFIVAATIAKAFGYAVADVWMMNIVYTTVAAVLVVAIHAVLSLRPRLEWYSVPAKYRIALIASYAIVPALFISLIQLYGVRSIGSVVLLPIPALATIFLMMFYSELTDDHDTDVNRK
ncbi:hypothetical protein [Actinomyces naeslundii]|jgi:hypothetical protein|uniref:hypothetical protein n=1 Tax=Actinomyces naeslundii TaxID=1655 RepID=UPI0011786591|nr:hypothetical protein [Actinomyces naeslundii]